MNPRADIGDLYAWTSARPQAIESGDDDRGPSFSESVEYTFHVDSGKRAGCDDGHDVSVCRFGADQGANLSSGRRGRVNFRVFAGRRDDPFFNNVKGTRAAYQRAAAALP